jgi:mono/diheme cytochrome c family protein
LDDAFVADAKLAAECASCHVASGVVPEFASPPPTPPDKPTIEARMTRHLWASERLWEGIVGMADDSWRAGLDVLAATPLPASQLGQDRAVFARKLQRLAETARTPTTNGPDRATAYAEMLSTCAACHTARK